MLIEDLMNRPHVVSHKKEALSFAQEHQLDKTHARFSVGDIIVFWGGCNKDIRYSSEITGIDENGDIYVVWECFWFPIRDDSNRKIQLAA